MTGNDLSRARVAEYKQQRAVNLLREQVHGRADGEPPQTLVEKLIAAEEQLSALRAARAALEGAPDAATIALLDKQQQSTGTSRRGQLTSHKREAGDVLGEATTGIDIKVLPRMDQVPTSIAHLLDAKRAPLVSFIVKYSGDKFIRLRLTTYVEGYSARATDTLELLAGAKEEVVDQFPTFFPAAVAAVSERTRATLHVQIDDIERDRCEMHRSFPIWLLPRTTAYLSVLDPATDKVTDLTPYLAAYVTPNAERVMTVLREAADVHPGRAMVGYQGLPAQMAATVRDQVKAIYTALRARKITYINSVVCFGGGPAEALQRIRLPREALETKSANCIDGTVLMASVLEAASLDAGIVLVPGHAFLAFATGPGGDAWEFVETTMLGTHDFDDAHARAGAEAAQYQALAKTSGDASAFRLLPISMLRTAFGILPME